MKPKEFKVLDAAANYRSASWFEALDRIETTNDLVARGLIKKVDLHRPDTGAEPRHYRFTDKGRDLWERGKTWETAKSLALPED